MSTSKTTPADSETAGDETTTLNSIEATAEEHVASDAEGQALQEEEPLLCPPVCLGYAAGAFASGYLATQKVAHGSADQASDVSAFAELVEDQDVSQDASVEELIELRSDE